MARTGTNTLLFLFLMGCTSLNKQEAQVPRLLNQRPLQSHRPLGKLLLIERSRPQPTQIELSAKRKSGCCKLGSKQPAFM